MISPESLRFSLYAFSSVQNSSVFSDSHGSASNFHFQMARSGWFFAFTWASPSHLRPAHRHSSKRAWRARGQRLYPCVVYDGLGERVRLHWRMANSLSVNREVQKHGVGNSLLLYCRNCIWKTHQTILTTYSGKATYYFSHYANLYSFRSYKYSNVFRNVSNIPYCFSTGSQFARSYIFFKLYWWISCPPSVLQICACIITFVTYLITVCIYFINQ